MVLNSGSVSTRLPAHDLDRARRFYADKLGLRPADERPGGLLYRCGTGEFAVFESAGSSPGTFTQMAWEVNDIEATVAELSQRGVVFEDVDVPGLRTVGGIAEIPDNYPRKGARGPRGVVPRQRRQPARHRPTRPLTAPAITNRRAAAKPR
jgi:catechol 2,3-dioxygenase-like lactoylglutathione lyase family enzyme